MSGAGRTAMPAVLVALICLVSPVLGGQPCSVPGSHSTIQDAVDDATCATIILAAQTYLESLQIPRSVTLAGPEPGGAVVQGLVEAVGSGTVATLHDLGIENGCFPNALWSLNGARVSGSKLAVRRSTALPCPHAIFRDGFESGDTSAWSSTVP